MRHLFTSLFTILVFILVTSCKKDEKVTIPTSGEYLPMQVQNYWQIQDYLTYTITGKKVIDNKTYFIFVQGYDTSYYRNENNKTYVRRSSGDESVKFNFETKTNETWEFQDGGTTWTVKRNASDTITINNTKIPNCYEFFFDIPMGADAAHSIWLAPGIGFIKMTCGFCPYPYLNLNKARINNKEITFP